MFGLVSRNGRTKEPKRKNQLNTVQSFIFGEEMSKIIERIRDMGYCYRDGINKEIKRSSVNGDERGIIFKAKKKQEVVHPYVPRKITERFLLKESS